MTQEEFFKRYTYSVSRDRIGGGGFGTVYKAKDNLLHRTVAIKVSEVKTSSDGRKTFSLKDEFEALSHVPKHPNIANYEEFYSFESPQGIFDYAVMQFYPDGNLGNAIKEGMTEQQKEDVAIQLLEGIGFLHQHKVVHRDLKPGNILIVRDGSKIIPLITDFGLSKAASLGDASVFTNSFGGGTPRYSSPEQLQGQPLRFNTDLWSFGAILYEVFTGQQLFSPGSGASNTAQADMEIFNKIVHGDVKSLGNMPEKWRQVAERCLVVDPQQRAKTAEELLAIIRESEEATEITVLPGEKSPEPQADASFEAKTNSKPSSGSDRNYLASEPGPRASKSSSTPNVKAPKETTPKETAPKETTPKESAPKIVSSKDRAPKPTTEKPSGAGKSKKGLWIGLAVAAAAIVLAVLLLKPKKEVVSLDTQAYNACQTVNDYRAYMDDYGRNAEHYADAKAFVDNFVADSLSKVELEKEEAAYKQCVTIASCDSYLNSYPQGRFATEVKAKKAELEQQLAQQQAETEAKSQAEAKAKAEAQAEADRKKEYDFYNKCATIADCDSYLKTYPQGRYVSEVKKKKAELEKAQQQAAAEAKAKEETEKQEKAAYQNCTTIAACDSYLKTYPQGRYVIEVKKKKADLEKAQQSAQKGNSSANGHAYVDLGLPNGTLWATCNVGANRPEDNGDYYGWGEMDTKVFVPFDWNSYKYANGDSDRLTKYCSKSKYGDNRFTDDLTVLQTNDDPAASWGSGWRTPSKEQWDELVKNTTNKWTTQNGVKGWLFISKKNSQTLFLPAAGEGNLSFLSEGNVGQYWSRSLNTGSPFGAWCLSFNSSEIKIKSEERFRGYSVRPVRQK